MPFASDGTSLDLDPNFAPVELNRARGLIELLKRRETQRTFEEIRRRREKLQRQLEGYIRSINRSLSGQSQDDDDPAAPPNAINDRIGRGTFDP